MSLKEWDKKERAKTRKEHLEFCRMMDKNTEDALNDEKSGSKGPNSDIQGQKGGKRTRKTHRETDDDESDKEDEKSKKS